MRPTSRPSSGFTLIELAAVLVIIAILAAILFPVFARAREHARTASCRAGVAQLGAAIHMYARDFDGALPDGATAGPALQRWFRLGEQPFECPSQGRASRDPFYNPDCTRGHVQRWGDYLYVPGLRETDPADLPILIERRPPPYAAYFNDAPHLANRGHVVLLGGKVLFLNPHEFGTRYDGRVPDLRFRRQAEGAP